MHVFPLLLQFWRYTPEENFWAQDHDEDAWWLEKCWGNYQGLSYVLTHRQEKTLDLQSLPIPTLLEKHQLQLNSIYCWKDLSIDLRQIIISTERVSVMIWFLVLSAGIHKSQLRQNCLYLPRESTSYDLLLVVFNRLTKISKPMQMMSAIETQSTSWSLGSSNTTSKFNCGYRLHIF